MTAGIEQATIDEAVTQACSPCRVACGRGFSPNSLGAQIIAEKRARSSSPPAAAPRIQNGWPLGAPAGACE